MIFVSMFNLTRFLLLRAVFVGANTVHAWHASSDDIRFMCYKTNNKNKSLLKHCLIRQPDSDVPWLFVAVLTCSCVLFILARTSDIQLTYSQYTETKPLHKTLTIILHVQHFLLLCKTIQQITSKMLVKSENSEMFLRSSDVKGSLLSNTIWGGKRTWMKNNKS